MDETDKKLIGALRQNARRGLSDLAHDLGVSRTTVRSRLERLVESGEIVGFTVRLRQDVETDAVRGLMMLAIEGRGTDRILHRLLGLTAVREVHSTNGKWDLIVEIGTDSLASLDTILADIRRIDGVQNSETNLLLKSRRTRSLK
ncbi:MULTISPECIES: Lrp/AsnC family transcriptional regulator [Halocynthiibacter]|uniref:Lrp/AsnC family transcriptional regulator n=1 Tax=Halocynthiibacter halioticoli TaxID=2986804 RepID=A0AAE3LT17_9RHOB|nr:MULTISPECIES: Lrp/AsnC family transcriptional regulator [Halocynthiibacter]MCV6824336.1 Lrp/AsnC family transcriptional regulator [Halocynthiibacter halioticoli]MCW4057337.1 Lrp/AsnC family transcriptional regulator [Halocynthiibacter sp. SDUM655004]MDE0589625.1 Lrp/AsnC family transcriptional regulator [Halocynthiibacter sp. C4]